MVTRRIELRKKFRRNRRILGDDGCGTFIFELILHQINIYKTVLMNKLKFFK